MRCPRARILCSALVLVTVCEFCLAQGYYGYNPYYPYYRRPATAAVAQQARRTAAATASSNRLRNNYLTNPYASVASNNPRNTALNTLPDIYRRRPTASTTTTTTQRPTNRYRVSKADAENAKFVGASNQESTDESTKTFQLLNRRRRPYGNRCSLFGRQNDPGTSASTAPKEQGRFLWDLNVYNIYGGGVPPIGGGGLFSDPIQSSAYGCGGGLGGGLGGLGGGLLGGGGGGGLLSDPYDNGYGPAAPPLNTLLSLFAPGILQNALAATARPPPLALAPQNDPPTGSDLQSDPAVDPNYGSTVLPVRPPPAVPNRIYYDTPGASPITPAQLIGGVATTVNGIIQQLTGNLQPVYPGYG